MVKETLVTFIEADFLGRKMGCDRCVSLISSGKAILEQPDFKSNLSLASAKCSGETGGATMPKGR